MVGDSIAAQSSQRVSYNVRACGTWSCCLQLRVIMCTFVSKMLESSSFNKLLSGAKNCYKVLQLSVGKYRQQGYEPEVRWNLLC